MPNNPEARKRYMAEYRMRHKADNREAADAYQKAYREKYRDKLNQTKREDYQLRREILKQRVSEWRKKHPEWGRNNYHKNRERELAFSKASYRRHRVERLAAAKEYVKQNPHVRAKADAARRLRIDATIGGEAAMSCFIKSVRRARRIACYYCKNPVRGKLAHIDHIIPLSRGGSHTPDNLCASCPACNLSKHARFISEWKPVGQQVLPL